MRCDFHNPMRIILLSRHYIDYCTLAATALGTLGKHLILAEMRDSDLRQFFLATAIHAYRGSATISNIGSLPQLKGELVTSRTEMKDQWLTRMIPFFCKTSAFSSASN